VGAPQRQQPGAAAAAGGSWLRRKARRLRQRARRAGLGPRSGFRRSLADPQAALSLDMSSDSTTLLVAFGGRGGGVGVPPFEFFAATAELPVKRLFVRDLHQTWYQHGIEGQGGTIREAAESLRELIDRHGAQRIVTAGSSAGGYAALAFASILGAERALSFGPQTVLDPSVQAAIGDLRWQDVMTELEREGGLDPEWIDLREALPRERERLGAGPRYDIFFSEVNTRPGQPGRDRAHAERLAGIAGVRLYRFGSGGHMIARRLRDCGALERVLRRALEEPAKEPSG